MGDGSQKLGTWTIQHTLHTLCFAQQLGKMTFPGYSVGLSLQAVNLLFPFSLLVLYLLFQATGLNTLPLPGVKLVFVSVLYFFPV